MLSYIVMLSAFATWCRDLAKNNLQTLLPYDSRRKHVVADRRAGSSIDPTGLSELHLKAQSIKWPCRWPFCWEFQLETSPLWLQTAKITTALWNVVKGRKNFVIESPTMHERCLVRKVVDSCLKSVQFMNSVCEMIIANTHSAMATYLL